MKHYLEELANKDEIIVFDDLRNDWTEDEDGNWYTESEEDFEWWQELANALSYLKERDIKADVYELADYIDVAKSNGYKTSL